MASMHRIGKEAGKVAIDDTQSRFLCWDSADSVYIYDSETRTELPIETHNAPIQTVSTVGHNDIAFLTICTEGLICSYTYGGRLLASIQPYDSDWVYFQVIDGHLALLTSSYGETVLLRPRSGEIVHRLDENPKDKKILSATARSFPGLLSLQRKRCESMSVLTPQLLLLKEKRYFQISCGSSEI